MITWFIHNDNLYLETDGDDNLEKVAEWLVEENVLLPKATS